MVPMNDKTLDRNWEDLPPELIQSIAKQLGDLVEFLCFRLVCKKWRSATTRSSPPPQLPWLLNFDYNSSTFHFYSLSTCKVHAIHVEKNLGFYHKWMTPSYHYIFNCRDSFTGVGAVGPPFLYNPLTQKSIKLPFLNVSYPMQVPFLNDSHHFPFLIGPSSIRTQECVALMTNTKSNKKQILFCRPGDTEWSIVEKGPHDDGACLFYKGMVYINMDDTGVTKVVSLVTNSIVTLIPPPVFSTGGSREGFSYFVESLGVLLGVRWSKGICETHVYGLEVYQLLKENTYLKWAKMDTLGDRILFVSSHNGYSFSARDCGGLEGNCIYYKALDDDRECLMRYDFEKCVAEQVPCPLAKVVTWFMPSLVESIESNVPV
ncbi:F-box family protein [Rhynchospora pubera]|uniref:F-box family protein n=1 Tax=Rhynchospora pubera TaxID=906938 RepID=A0AAV8C2F2_9POAL|nr:F-box family protein [Rhynchospora pubera]